LRIESLINECNGRRGREPNEKLETAASLEVAGLSHLAAIAVTQVVRGCGSGDESSIKWRNEGRVF
jgi:hypothetical protein